MPDSGFRYDIKLSRILTHLQIDRHQGTAIRLSLLRLRAGAKRHQKYTVEFLFLLSKVKYTSAIYRLLVCFYHKLLLFLP